MAAGPGATNVSPHVANRKIDPAPNMSGTTRTGAWRTSIRASHSAPRRENTAETPMTGGSVLTAKCDR